MIFLLTLLIVHCLIGNGFPDLEIGDWQPYSLETQDNQVKGSDKRTVHLVAFSNKIIEESCISMETAILNGWTYNLLTKVPNSDSKEDATNNSQRRTTRGQRLLSLSAETPQFNKILAYNASLSRFPLGDLVLFVDAFDVIIQGNFEQFVDKVYDVNSISWDYRKTLLYNAEDNCHPFNVVNQKYNCPLTQGLDYLSDRSAHSPTGCRLQVDRAPNASMEEPQPVVYLNSGVSLGSVDLYRDLFNRAASDIEMLKKGKDKCLIDDQGIISWLYATRSSPISIDFESALLATSQLHRLKDYEFDNFTGMWENIDTKVSPPIVHFAGSKRALRVYHKKIRKWHADRIAMFIPHKNMRLSTRDEKLMEVFLLKKTVNIDGKDTPFFDVCPDSRRYSWNKLLKGAYQTADNVLKATGLSPQHAPPKMCPEEYCPPLITIF